MIIRPDISDQLNVISPLSEIDVDRAGSTVRIRGRTKVYRPEEAIAALVENFLDAY